MNNCHSNLNYFHLPCDASDHRKETIEKISISKHDYFERYGKSLVSFLNKVKDDANLSITLSPVKRRFMSNDTVLKYSHECTIKTTKFEDVVFNITIDLS